MNISFSLEGAGLTVTFPNDNIMDVVKPKDKDCVVIACATQVAPQHQNLQELIQTKVKFHYEFPLSVFVA